MTISYRVNSSLQRINRLHCTAASSSLPSIPSFSWVGSNTAQYWLGIQSSLGNPQKYRKGLLMTPNQSWRQLAAQASVETDPSKLLDLVTELNRVLREEEMSRQRRLQGNQPSLFHATA